MAAPQTTQKVGAMTNVMSKIPFDKLQGALGPMAQYFAAANAPTEINAQTIFTPEMLDRYLNNMGQYMNTQNAFYGTPYQGPGGVSVNQPRQMSRQEIVGESYTNYLISKGYSRENAQKRTNQIIADKKLAFKSDKGFKNYINKGNAPGLKVGSGGGIQAAKKFTQGGIQSGAPGIGAQVQGLGQESLAAAAGLPTMLAQDLARSLGAKQQLQGQIGNFLQQGFGPSGLTPQEQANYDATKAKYMQDYGDLYRDTMQSTTGQLVDSGFASSNLAAGALQRGAYDAQSRFLTGAMGELAAKENDLINSRFARQSQNLSNLLNTYGTLGANQGIGSVLGGFISPGQGGYLTEAQSAALLAEMQQNQARNRQIDQSMMNNALGTPLQMVPTSGGSKAGSALGGAASGALAGARFGPWGAVAGGALGALGGLFK